LANIGVSTEPVTIADYSEKTRARLFAHDAMRGEVKLLDPIQTEAGTGALGRLADVLQHNGFKTGRVVVDSTGVSLAGRSLSPTVTLDALFAMINMGACLVTCGRLFWVNH